MIISFACKKTAALFAGTSTPKEFRAFKNVAERKLAQLDAVEALLDLASPPGNGLEKLTKDRVGQYSIRVSGKWRVCFRWTPAGPADVEIVDYH